MSRRNRKFAFAPEALENRIVMAGDVAGVVNNDNLKLTGDDLGNEILVQQVNATQFRVTGLNGTTINGQAVQDFNFNGNSLDIRLNGGNDLLEIDDFNGADLNVDKLSIDLGEGNDIADLDDFNVNGTNTTNIKLGAGNQNERDVLILQDANFGGNSKIQTGGGDDGVVLDDTNIAGNLEIDTAAGDDIVEISDLKAENLKVKLGDGTIDRLDVFRCEFANKMSVDGGNGDDAVHMDKVKAVEFTVDFRQGSSDLQVEDTDVSGRLQAKGGDGNNAVGMNDVTAIEARLDYGKGKTNIDVLGIGTPTFSIKTGKLNDVVSVKNSVIVDFLTNLGDGDDQFNFTNSLNLNSKFDLGQGNDKAVLDGVFSNGDLQVLGKNGDDDVKLKNVSFATALLDGGNDADTLTQVNVNIPAKVVKNFETLI